MTNGLGTSPVNTSVQPSLEADPQLTLALAGQDVMTTHVPVTPADNGPGIASSEATRVALAEPDATHTQAPTKPADVAINTDRVEQDDDALAGQQVMETVVTCEPRYTAKLMAKLTTMTVLSGAGGTVLGKFCVDVLHDHPRYLAFVEKVRTFARWLL